MKRLSLVLILVAACVGCSGEKADDGVVKTPPGKVNVTVLPGSAAPDGGETGEGK